jgi:hypothetical protein
MPHNLSVQDVSRSLRIDAAASAFFLRELELIDQEMYNIKYADLEAFQLVPVKTDLHPGLETYTYRTFDSRGVAQMTANYASGSPRADVDGVETTSKVRSIRASYGYNVQEIRAAAMANRPLETMRATAARRAINEKINTVALKGDAEHGLVGLFNQSGTQTFTVPTGVGGFTWPLKTADEILLDMYGIVDQVPTNTSEVEHVTVLLLPYTRYRLIAAKRTGTGDGALTVLNVFHTNRPNVKVRGALYLDTAGASANMRMIGYNPDRVNLELLLPVAFESFPPEQRGLEFVVENHARMGGVVVRYPLTIIYGDGI